ncbi:hypothetical protein VTK73DRAFT_4436 [Phialemonium thermophilum]|uniref:Uncharacterized protein n=1 Tax=Phialemonium thermophilum TaxID=223376 RepID=A0ABR3WU17_9PEZI
MKMHRQKKFSVMHAQSSDPKRSGNSDTSETRADITRSTQVIDRFVGQEMERATRTRRHGEHSGEVDSNRGWKTCVAQSRRVGIMVHPSKLQGAAVVRISKPELVCGADQSRPADHLCLADAFSYRSSSSISTCEGYVALNASDVCHRTRVASADLLVSTVDPRAYRSPTCLPSPSKSRQSPSRPQNMLLKPG